MVMESESGMGRSTIFFFGGCLGLLLSGEFSAPVSLVLLIIIFLYSKIMSGVTEDIDWPWRNKY